MPSVLEAYIREKAKKEIQSAQKDLLDILYAKVERCGKEKALMVGSAKSALMLIEAIHNHGLYNLDMEYFKDTGYGLGSIVKVIETREENERRKANEAK
ncbi:MAG: hypothetical protein JRI72_00310 [Deltaproteobacteria bacterium]|nr:hypothetical protein [Deltaproteobacteria bacterium]